MVNPNELSVGNELTCESMEGFIGMVDWVDYEEDIVGLHAKKDYRNHNGTFREAGNRFSKTFESDWSYYNPVVYKEYRVYYKKGD